MSRRFFSILFMALGVIFAAGHYFYSMGSREDFDHQATYSISNNAQNTLEDLQKRVTVLVKDIKRQHQEYQTLKTEVSRLNRLLNAQLNLSATENRSPEAIQLSYSEPAQDLDSLTQGDTNKAELRKLVMKLLEETITQQHEAILNQQFEQDKLKKTSFTDPEQARQYSIEQMSEKLDLNEEQKKAYQHYVESYADLNRESNQQIAQDYEIAGGDADKILAGVTEKLEQEEESAQQFEEDFVGLLDANQAQIYRALPENERKIIGNRFFTENDL